MRRWAGMAVPQEVRKVTSHSCLVSGGSLLVLVMLLVVYYIHFFL